MPTFDLTGWSETHAAASGLRILATMIHPTDEDLRTELHAALIAALYDVIRDDPDAWTREPTIEVVYPLLLARHLGGSKEEVFQRARDATRRGSVAGEALIIIRQMAEHGQAGSVNKACDILARAGRAGRLTGGHVQIPFANSMSLRTQAWVPYRSVAHLWAAHNMMWSSCRNAAPDGERPPVSWYERSPDLERFLAIAEDFRRWREGYIPPARQKEQESILRPIETWRIPAEVSLPAGRLVLSPLDPYYQRLLQTYEWKWPARRGRTRKSRKRP
jgi:hypothetical protein